MALDKKTAIKIVIAITIISMVIFASVVYFFASGIKQFFNDTSIKTTPSNDDVNIVISFFKEGHHGYITCYLTLQIYNNSGSVIWEKRDIHIVEVESWNERVNWSAMSPEPTHHEQLTVKVSWGLASAGMQSNIASDTFIRP
ncbi:MAG: hypothetical protein HZB92_07420 [Euryarchaeota archaeon]|nr:hypothetical protein [Euryarchaeota archaeon]